MKKVLNFSGFLSEQDDYNKDLENDLVRKNAKSVAAGPFLDSRQNDNNKSKKSSVNEMLATTVTKFQSGGGLKRAIKLFCCRAGARSGLGVMG